MGTPRGQNRDTQSVFPVARDDISNAHNASSPTLSAWTSDSIRIAVPPSAPPETTDATARLLLVALSLAWGVTWPTMKIALYDIPPFSMRVGTLSIGATLLFSFALARGQNLAIPAGIARAHVLVAGLLNVTAFSLL